MKEITLDPIDIRGAPEEPAPEPVAPPQGVKGIGLKETPGMIAVRNPDGSVDQVRLEDAEAAVRAGARPATETELQAEVHGLPGRVASGVMGVVRGASMGLSDPLYVAGARAIGGDAMAEDTRRTLQQMKEGNPGWSLGGEVIGSLAPLAFGAPPGEAAVSLGEGFLARAGARAVSAAPRAFVEGGIMGLGQQASEDTLGNHEAVASKYLSSGLKGGALGILLAGGLTAGGGAASDALGGLLRRGATVETSAANVLERAGLKAGEEAGAIAPKTGVAGWAERHAADQAVKSVLPSASLNASELSRLGRTAEEQGERVQRIGKNLIEQIGTDPLATKATLASKITARVEEVGEELASMRKPLDTASVRPSLENIGKRFEDEVLKPLQSHLFADKEAGPAIDIMDRLAARMKENPSFEALHEARTNIDDFLFKAYERAKVGPLPPGESAIKQLRGIVESEYTRAGEEAAKELGGTFAQKYNVAKEVYADLATAQKWVTKAAARQEQNRAISLTDTVMGGAALASGNPLALLAPIANKGVREFGNQIASHVLAKVARIGQLQRAAEVFDDGVAKGARAFLSGEKVATSEGTHAKVTSETVRELRNVVRDPIAVGAKVEAALGDMPRYAPKVATAAAQTVMRSAAYLNRVLPKEPPPAGIVFGKREDRPMKDTDLAKAQRVIDVLEDSRVVIDLMQSGKLTADHVQAMRVFDPHGYQQIRKSLIEHAEELEPKLSYQQQIQFSVLFGVAMNATMRPQSISQLQSVYAQGADPSQTAQAGGIGSMTPKRPLQRGGDSLASATDRLEAAK